jgi:hypothetical protein
MYVCIYIHVCLYACIRTYVCMYVCICVHVLLDSQNMRTKRDGLFLVAMRSRIFMRIHEFLFTRVNTYAYMRVLCVCTYVPMYVNLVKACM